MSARLRFKKIHNVVKKTIEVSMKSPIGLKRFAFAVSEHTNLWEAEEILWMMVSQIDVQTALAFWSTY